MLAALQGAVLLAAAERQDGISAALSLHDYETDMASKQEIDRLVQLSEQQLLIILELQADFRSNHWDEASSEHHRGQSDPGRWKPASPTPPTPAGPTATSRGRQLRSATSGS